MMSYYSDEWAGEKIAELLSQGEAVITPARGLVITAGYGLKDAMELELGYEIVRLLGESELEVTWEAAA